MIPWVDWLVIAWFIFCWGGYTFFADRQSATKPSLLVSMRIYRREWFKLALGHDNRIGDISALNSLLTGATFFRVHVTTHLGWVMRIIRYDRARNRRGRRSSFRAA